MKHQGWIIGWMLLALAAAIALAGENADKSSGGPAPLKVDKSAPRLLDRPVSGQPGDKPEGPVADNSDCHLCHGDFREESLAVSHAKANIGCVKCHGQSLEHRNDKDKIIPPENMFPKTMIDAVCRRCHEQHNAAAAIVIARWQKKCPQKTDASQIRCTDCHGEHRMKVRSVCWDKETGKLISQEAVEGKKPAVDGKKK